MTYAGFWRRSLAYIIDTLLFILVLVVVEVVFGAAFECVTSSVGTGEETSTSISCQTTNFSNLFLIFGGWLYFALMEASRVQGTLGKMAMGAKVTDLDGNRVSFLRATGRYFGKFVSAIILVIGFIMVAFTKRKQGLHDIMAKCLVVRRSA